MENSDLLAEQLYNTLWKRHRKVPVYAQPTASETKRKGPTAKIDPDTLIERLKNIDGSKNPLTEYLKSHPVAIKSGSAEDFVNWAKMVKRDFLNNPVDQKDVLRQALLGGGGAALATYLWGKLRGKKTRWGRIVANTLLGAGLGAGSAYFDAYMAGKPFDNSGFDIAKINKGDKVYLGVAGAANGEGTSWFGNAMRRRLPQGHVKMFRWGEGKDLEQTYKDLVAKGAVPVIVGHSRGGKIAAKFLQDHPEAKGYLLDPVSWMGRSHPANATVFSITPKERHGGEVENYIADAGGRWNLEDPGTFLHVGSHSDHMPSIISDFILPGYDRDNLPKVMPNYITSYHRDI